MNQNQIIFCIHRYDFQILCCHAGCAHVTSHFLALEHLARILALTSRTMGTMRDRHTVRGTKTAKIMPLHRTGKTLTLRNANGIHHLAGNIVICAQSGAHFQNRIIADAKFCQLALWQNRCFGKMTTHGFGNILYLGLTCAQLQRDIAVPLSCFCGNNLYVFQLQNSYRKMFTGVIKNPGHSNFSGNYTATHNALPLN